MNISHVLEILKKNKNIFVEIQNFFKEEDDREKEENLKTNLLHHVRKLFDKDGEKMDVEKYCFLIDEINIQNSNFTYTGCRHEIEFWLGEMHISYQVTLKTSLRQREPCEQQLCVDGETMLFLSFHCPYALTEFSLEKNYDEYLTFDEDEQEREKRRQRFISLSAIYFPAEKPELLFKFIMRVFDYFLSMP